MLYMMVLWVELGPAFLEKWKASGSQLGREFAEYFSPRLSRALPFIIALGILLPTMHQSSLCSLLIIAGQKVHPLWQTPLLPLLFLISCIPMGYGAVIMESQLATRVFGRRSENDLLRDLRGLMSLLLLAYVAIRLGDLAVRGQLGHLGLDGFTALFALEIGFFLAAAYFLKFRTLHAPVLFRTALLVLLGGALYRFSAFLFAFNPGPGWSYFPAVPELMITIGIISGEIALYLLIVKKLPILAALPKTRVQLPAGTPVFKSAEGGVEPVAPASGRPSV
jgi:Ni/Fe-hydrogenase subunit HybB-like protein